MADNNGSQKEKNASWPFYASAAFFFLLGVALFLIYIIKDYTIWQAQLLPILSLLIGAVFFNIPSFRKETALKTERQLSTLQSLGGMMTDLDNVRREHYKERAAIESLHAEWQNEMTKLIEDIQKSGLQANEKSDLENALISKRMECVEFEKEVGEWAERVIEFFTFLERTKSLPNLKPDYLNAINKSLAELERNFSPMGLMTIRPEAGNVFDSRIHEAAGEEKADGIDKGKVARVLCWGYQRGPHIVKRAEVMLSE